MPKHCVIIANPVSGLGLGRINAPRLADRLRRSGVRVDLFWTDGPGAARAAAERVVPSETDAILCVGGDGTVSEVATGIGDRGVPLATFPTGTGNVLAKEFRIPYSVPRVCDMILRGRTRNLDVGVVNDHRFVLFAGAGFDAAVARRLREARTGRISMLNYAIPLLAALAEYDSPPVRVTVDGRLVGTAASVLVSNVRSYGGPFVFVPWADPTDGWFNVCLLPGSRRRDIARYAWGGLTRGLLRLGDVTHVRGREVRLEADGEVPLQADGDFLGCLPVRIELLPGRLPMIVR